MLKSIIQLYKNAYAGLTRRMWLLSIVMLINRCGTMVLPFMTLYCSSKGYTATQGGLAVAFYGVGAVVGAFIGGKLSDRFGFYRIQLMALAGGGIMFILLGQMESYPGLCICIFFTSMINESFRPANASAIAHYSDAQHRTQSFSLVRLAINLGWGIGSALAGILASYSYHLLFWVDGGTNIAAAIALFFLLPEVSILQQKKNIVAGSEQKTSPYKDKIFIFFIGCILLFAICFFQLFTTVPLFFKEALHLSEWKIGVVLALNGILIGVFEMVIVFKLEGRKSYLTLMTIGTLILSCTFFMMNIPMSNGWLLSFIIIVMVTIAEIIGMPFMNSFYISRSNPGNRGNYAALFTMAWSTAQVIGSLTGARIEHLLGFDVLWWIMGMVCLVTAGGFVRLHGNLKKTNQSFLK